MYQRKELKIKTLTDESLEILRTDKSSKDDVIKGCCNYELLNNIIYSNKLRCLSLDLRQQTFESELMDFITRIIYSSPHNQTEQVDDMMKLITDEVNTNLSIQMTNDFR